MNKKAGANNILILVIMTIIITSSALLTFYVNMRQVNATIADTKFVDKIFYSEINYETELKEVVFSRFLNMYEKIDPQNPITNIEIGDKMSGIELIDKSSNQLKKVFVNITDNEIFAYMEEFPISGNLIINDNKKIWLWGFVPMASYDEQKALIGVIYRPEISVRINSTKEGLHSIKDINNALFVCKNQNKTIFGDCLNRLLYNFNIDMNGLSDEEVKGEIGLETKNRYLIDDEIRSIKFRLDI